MDNLRVVCAVILLLLTAFTTQSLPLVVCRSAFYKVLPMVMFWVPLQCIVDTAWETGNLREAVMEYLVFLLAITAGDILGWVIGLRFRKILDAERAAGGTDNRKES